MRYWIILMAAMLLVSCGQGAEDSADSGQPKAVLKVPACAKVGTVVKFDASGSTDDGEILKYMFTIIPGQAVPLINNRAHIYHVFDKPTYKGKYITQYQVRLQVVDDSGMRAEDAQALFIVKNLDQCPEEPVYIPDIVEDIADVMEQPPDISSELYEPDTVVPDLPDIDTKPDVKPVDVEPVECPNIEHPYRLEILCYGSTHATLDVSLIQNGCSVVDDFGILSGEFTDGNHLKMKSIFEDLNINDCEGDVEDTSSFALNCTSDCTAVFNQTSLD